MFKKNTLRLLWQVLGAIAFYTILPIPASWPLEFSRMTRWAPIVGSLLGLVLCGVDFALSQTAMSDYLRSAVVVLFWIYMTGGLHLDGAMDSADGLGVFDPEKRLEVMSDSRSGAFGVLVAIAIILLKVMALAGVSSQRWWALCWVPVWGRWAQVVAVGQYPYLKPSGKGRLHRDTFVSGWDYLPGCILGMMSLGLVGLLIPHQWLWFCCFTGLGLTLSWTVGYWFYRQFNGMTGDIYGAIVEWTEVLLLVSLAGLGDSPIFI